MSTAAASTTSGVTDATFRAAMGRFASGVTVITARAAGVDRGATVSAFSSVSNEPPSVLVCLNRSSDTCEAVGETGSFVVNVLSRRDEELARRFAGKGLEKFDGLAVHRSRLQHPVLPGNHMTLECRVSQAVHFGTHGIFVAEVLDVAVGPGTTPLTYHAGRFGRFAAAPLSRKDALLPDFGDHHDLW